MAGEPEPGDRQGPRATPTLASLLVVQTPHAAGVLARKAPLACPSGRHPEPWPTSNETLSGRDHSSSIPHRVCRGTLTAPPKDTHMAERCGFTSSS